MRRPGFTLEQVRSFVAVAEQQQISKAASSLYLTQAAVTQQVRHFEKALGLDLLERSGRGVRLTDAGRRLAEACRAVLRATEVVDDTARAVKDLQAGSLHIGASPTCASYYLPHHLAEFTRRHPGVKLNVVVEATAELNRAVASGALDCALIEGEPDKGLLAIELSKDELVIVAHSDHPLAHQRGVKPADLLRHRYLRRGPTWSGERYVRQLMGDRYDDLDMLNLGHPEYVRAATLAGLGYSVMPKRAVISDLAAGTLKRLGIPAIVRSISAIRRPDRGGPAQEAFWDLVTGSEPAGTIPIDGRRTAVTS